MNEQLHGEVSPYTGGRATLVAEVAAKKKRIACLRRDLRRMGIATLENLAAKSKGKDIAAGAPCTQLPLWTKI